ncbi:ATP synthase I chain [Plautia stali symbiont]|nr:ATP synthase I chain [Plautia stali symbiont]
MSVSFYSVKLARTVLVIQLVTFVVIGALFALKDVTWGTFAIAGGAAAWLPNVLFMFLAWRLQDQTPAKGRVA